MKNLTIAISFFFLMTISIGAQDVIFSQYDHAAIYLNSALTGNFEGKLRGSMILKDTRLNSLGSFYRTGLLSIDSKSSLGNNRTIGYGISTIIDRAGSSNFGSNQFHLNSSIIQNFGKSVNSNHSIALGVDFGLVRRQFLDLYNYYFDFSPGVVYSYSRNSTFSLQVGASIHHINRPNIAFSSVFEDKLYSRVNVHSNLEIAVYKGFSIVPSFLFVDQGPHNSIFSGSQFKYKFNTDNQKNPFSSLAIGLMNQSGRNYLNKLVSNGYILRTTIETEKARVGLSYDFTKIYRRSIEMSLQYRFGKESSKKKLETS